ncbi:uncharacterized protein EV420DRAFT_1582234 [Desarmillaria tabescens]|uniref:Chromatin elongation factor spt5 n=1 Tax=Armillaria tabescens TaxID=1929756 RepID=A0AA39JCG5_ARMTA|nr:uncharacterized protein EV420DRAFT_1582234 [Desarmillaria tabescens]KAK0440212.1 hypothetical protein EV420DRAFT_1582234 [Desarmillaria tabescens]
MTSMPTSSHRSEDPTPEQLEEYASAVIERARKRRRVESDLAVGGLDSVDSLWVVGASGPLWRVRIKKHTQDHLVSRLKHYKTPDHGLITAFALPAIPQWVYLDCQYVNSALRQLLSSSCAVATANGQPILEEVPVEDSGPIRTMQKGKPNPQKGDWVRVTRGPYRNDVACVREIYDWGAEVLVIPRFYAPEHRRCPQREKRQHSSHSLWDSNRTLHRLGTMRQICPITKTQKRQNSEYDRGLLILQCEIQSLVTASTISASILGLFVQSQHSIVLQAELRAPCPMEWHFQVGDDVEISGNRTGVVCSISATGVEVSLDNGAGIHHIPFSRIIKRISVGDLVLCLESDREGLVQVVGEFHIVALAKGPNGEIEEFERPRNSVSRQCSRPHDYSEYIAKPKIVPHVGWIGRRVVVGAYGLVLRGKAGSVADVINEEGRPMAVVILDDEPDIARMFRPEDLTIEGRGEQLDIGETSNALEQIQGPMRSSGQTPWIGVQVGIFHTGHRLRSKIGTVRDVICGQDNASGLRLVIVLDTYDPATTNKEHTVDYEHVLEVETKRPLRLYKPLLLSQNAFLPRLSFIQSRYEERMEHMTRTLPGDFIRNRATTPPPNLDPAWDPRSKTPPLPDGSSISTSGFNPLSYEHHGHWATDGRLLGRELRIKLNGKAKTLIFRQGAKHAPVECYIRKGKKKIEAVPPELVEAIHPATPRNYERWVVIKGRHTGKYVRSIRYEKGATPKMPIWWTVAVVAPAEGQVDEQTGEELHLESTDLCLEEESESSRETNMLFSRKLREEAPRH